jgi:hypothetical protein
VPRPPPGWTSFHDKENGVGVAARNVVASGIAFAAMALSAGCGAGVTTRSATTASATPAAELHGRALAVRVAAALDTVRSARFTGTVSAPQDDPDPGSSGTLTAVVTPDAESGNLKTFSEGTLAMVMVNGDFYFRADSAFFKSSDDDSSAAATSLFNGIAAKFADHWLSMPLSSASTSGSEDSDDDDAPPPGGNITLHELTGSLWHPTADDSPILDTVTAATIDGHDAYVLSRRDGSKLYVDQQTLLPVRLNNSTTSAYGPCSLGVDHYNAVVSIVAPSGAVNLLSLFGASK